MKRLFMVVLLVLMMVTYAPAADRVFEWDQNTESDLKGYKMYRSVSSGNWLIPDPSDPSKQILNPTNLWLTVWKPGENPDTGNTAYDEYIVGPQGQCMLPRNILPDGTYYFVLTAFDNALNESGTSNEVSTIIDDTAPAPPNGFQCNQAQ